MSEYVLRINDSDKQHSEKTIEATNIEFTDDLVVFRQGDPDDHSEVVYVTPNKQLIDIERMDDKEKESDKKDKSSSTGKGTSYKITDVSELPNRKQFIDQRTARSRALNELHNGPKTVAELSVSDIPRSVRRYVDRLNVSSVGRKKGGDIYYLHGDDRRAIRKFVNRDPARVREALSMKTSRLQSELDEYMFQLLVEEYQLGSFWTDDEAKEPPTEDELYTEEEQAAMERLYEIEAEENYEVVYNSPRSNQPQTREVAIVGFTGPKNDRPMLDPEVRWKTYAQSADGTTHTFDDSGEFYTVSDKGATGHLGTIIEVKVIDNNDK